MTVETLQELGLSDKEAALYAACLELGPSRIKDLAAYTSLNRGTIYDVARALFKTGLLSSTQKKGVTYLVPQPPHHFIHQLGGQIRTAESLIPAIEQMIGNASYRPTLRYFEGDGGIRQVYEETLTARGKELLAFVSTQEILEVVGAEFIEYYIKKRVRRHIRVREINDPTGLPPVPTEPDIVHSDPALLRESRIGPISIDVAGLCMVYDDTVALMSTKRENFGVILESHEFATMMRNLFETVWAVAQPV